MNNREVQILMAANNNAVIAAYLLNKKSVQKKNKNKKYSSKWLLERESEGFSHKLLKEIEVEDLKLYRNILRMTPSQFQQILEKVKPHINKLDTNFRNSIPAGERLQITLRYLATGIQLFLWKLI